MSGPQWIHPRARRADPGHAAAGDFLACALQAERAGFDELWSLGEDYYCAGGIASAAALLARLSCRSGSASYPLAAGTGRLLALELATLAGMYPGRLRAGLGAGVPDLTRQIGTRLRSPLGSVRETLGAVRGLLSGQTVTVAGETFVTDGVALMHPPDQPPPIYVGAGGPKMLALSGTEADGTVLSVLSGREYVRWARGRLAEGLALAEHRLVVYALCAIDEHSDRAREMLRELVAYIALPSPRNALSEVQGFAEEAEQLLSSRAGSRDPARSRPLARRADRRGYGRRLHREGDLAAGGGRRLGGAVLPAGARVRPDARARRERAAARRPRDGARLRRGRPMTYSIIARDDRTDELGVAVQSHFFGAGKVVAWARAGAGAIATQAFANSAFGPKGLELLTEGTSAPDALARRIATDPGAELRQLAVIDAAGTTGVHTGAACYPVAEHEQGPGVSAQGTRSAAAVPCGRWSRLSKRRQATWRTGCWLR